MAFDELLAERIRCFFLEKGTAFEEKKMMGGLCFMVDHKMCCGTHTDKHSGENLIMLRVGEVAAEILIEQPHVRPMNFTGRPMKGYLFVAEGGFSNKTNLHKFLQLCLDFNPQAKASRKK